MSDGAPGGEGGRHPLSEGRLEVTLDSFAAEALGRECARLSVSPQELVQFAIAYYLADLDSGRIARAAPGLAGSADPPEP